MEMRRKMKKLTLFVWVLVCIVLSFLWMASPALAQEDDQILTLNMSRDFGYSSGTGDIQGTFSMRIRGPDDLIKVIFLIDDLVMYEDEEEPFRFQFITDNYALGWHTLSAIGYTQDGRVIPSQGIRVNFVSPEAGGQAVLRILIPLFSVIFGLMALSFIVTFLFGRGKTAPLGSQRNYGIVGGTICKRCNRPFALNLLAPNILVGKLDRCPHCGNWGIYRRYPIETLRTAEQAELASSGQMNDSLDALSTEERLKKAADESRYQDI
jgi:hypothetical protein